MPLQQQQKKTIKKRWQDRKTCLGYNTPTIYDQNNLDASNSRRLPLVQRVIISLTSCFGINPRGLSRVLDIASTISSSHIFLTMGLRCNLKLRSYDGILGRRSPSPSECPAPTILVPRYACESFQNPTIHSDICAADGYMSTPTATSSRSEDCNGMQGCCSRLCQGKSCVLPPPTCAPAHMGLSQAVPDLSEVGLHHLSHCGRKIQLLRCIY